MKRKRGGEGRRGGTADGEGTERERELRHLENRRAKAQNSSPKLATSTTTTTNRGLSCPLPLSSSFSFGLMLPTEPQTLTCSAPPFDPPLAPPPPVQSEVRGDGVETRRRRRSPVCPLLGWKKKREERLNSFEVTLNSFSSGLASHKDLVSLKPDRFLRCTEIYYFLKTRPLPTPPSVRAHIHSNGQPESGKD